MAQALKSCALTSLDLSCNRIFEEGLLHLTAALKTEDDLKTLRVLITSFIVCSITQPIILYMFRFANIHIEFYIRKQNCRSTYNSKSK